MRNFPYLSLEIYRLLKPRLLGAPMDLNACALRCFILPPPRRRLWKLTRGLSVKRFLSCHINLFYPLFVYSYFRRSRRTRKVLLLLLLSTRVGIDFCSASASLGTSRWATLAVDAARFDGFLLDFVLQYTKGRGWVFFFKK